MIENKEEFYKLLYRLRGLNNEGKLSKHLQAKLEAFEEVKGLVRLIIPVSSLTLKGKHKKLFVKWKMYLEKTPNNTYLINKTEYLENELVTVYKEIMID